MGLCLSMQPAQESVILIEAQIEEHTRRDINERTHTVTLVMLHTLWDTYAHTRTSTHMYPYWASLMKIHGQPHTLTHTHARITTDQPGRRPPVWLSTLSFSSTIIIWGRYQYSESQQVHTVIVLPYRRLLMFRGKGASGTCALYSLLNWTVLYM